MPSPVETAAVIGTGMMGPGIALTLALGGVRATIVSRNAANAAAGLVKARAQASVLVENELAAPEQIAHALELLSRPPISTPPSPTPAWWWSPVPRI